MFIILKQNSSVNIYIKKRFNIVIVIIWKWGAVMVKSPHPVSFSDKRITTQYELNWNSYTSNIRSLYSPWESHNFYECGVMLF